MLMHLAKFAVLAGVTFFIASLAGTGRVAYTPRKTGPTARRGR